jgi:hypothetical protein
VTRVFATGATRDTETGKLDYEGFLSPEVIDAFARYMDSNRQMADGTIRDSDNWQLGIERNVYMKSGWRHFVDWWRNHRGLEAREDTERALCGLLFNVMGYLHEHLKAATGYDELSENPDMREPAFPIDQSPSQWWANRTPWQVPAAAPPNEGIAKPAPHPAVNAPEFPSE